MSTVDRHAARILEELSAEPEGLTRPELMERLEMGRSTLYEVTGDMVKAGLLDEQSAPAGGTGRPAPRLVVRRKAGEVIGIDLGHGHVRVAAGTGSGARLTDPPEENKEINVDLHGSGETLHEVARRVKLIAAHHDLSKLRAVAVGVPAPMRDGMVASAQHLPNWANVEVAKELRPLLADALGINTDDLPIAVTNDANLGALGERLHGAAQGCDNFVYLKVSTGVGGGLVMDGELRQGAATAGEFGHMSVPPTAERVIGPTQLVLPREECTRCGKLDCVENLASCQAIVNSLVASGLGYGPDLTIRQVIDDAIAEGAATAAPYFQQAITHAGVRIGFMLAELVWALDPEMVVVGGLLARAKPLLESAIRTGLDRARREGAPPVKLALVEADRIELSEIEGAIALAAQEASWTVTLPTND